MANKLDLSDVVWDDAPVNPIKQKAENVDLNDVVWDEEVPQGRQVNSIPEEEFTPKNVAVETAKGTIGTIAKSAGNAAGGVLDAVLHPVRTAKSIGNVALGAAEKLIPGEQSHEPYANAVGQHYKDRYGNVDKIAETVATDPVGFVTDAAAPLGLKIGAKGVAKTAGVVKNVVAPPPETLIGKAQKLTTEVLQPGKAELTDALVQGKKHASVEQASKVISKSKNYTELTQNLDKVISETMDKRNAILKQDNYDVYPSYTHKLKKLIKEEAKNGQVTPEELRQMNGVYQRELKYLKKNNSKISRLDAQARKEYLQDLTDKLLQKLESGDIIDNQPARTKALNALREGLKDAVEGGNTNVAAYNSTYGGLRRAKELAAGQDALAQKAIPEGFVQSIIHMITRPGDIPSILAREATIKRANSLSSSTQKIDKLMKKAKAK